MNVTEILKFSLSLSAGLIEWKIDGNHLHLIIQMNLHHPETL